MQLVAEVTIKITFPLTVTQTQPDEAMIRYLVEGHVREEVEYKLPEGWAMRYLGGQARKVKGDSNEQR